MRCRPFLQSQSNGACLISGTYAEPDALVLLRLSLLVYVDGFHSVHRLERPGPRPLLFE